MMNKSARQTHLILGLGTGATQLIQGYEADSFVHANHHAIRISTLDAYTTGLDGWDFDREVLKALLDDAEIVLLVVGAGGKAGSAMATFAAEYAVSQKILIDVLLSKPYSWEGGRRMKLANTLIENLRAIGANVTVVDADSMETAEFDTASEALTVLDAAMAKEVSRWAESEK